MNSNLKFQHKQLLPNQNVIYKYINDIYFICTYILVRVVKCFLCHLTKNFKISYQHYYTQGLPPLLWRESV